MSVAGNPMPLEGSSDMLSPIGGERRANASTLRPAMKKKLPDLSIEEVIGTSIPHAAHASYKTPSNEMLLKKPLLGMASKKKLITFAEEIQNRKKLIPGSPHYAKIQDWNTIVGPNLKQKFNKEDRVTYADEIARRAKKKGAGPSPASYKKENYADYRIPGSYKTKDEKISFAAEAQNLLGETPLVKYDFMEMDKLKKKPRYTTFEKNLDRFGKNEKVKENDKDKISPSPA